MSGIESREKWKKTGLHHVPTATRISYSVAPHNFHIGLPNDPEFKSNLKVMGAALVRSGITGSLQKLPDGTNYLRGSNDITITNNSDGSITVGTSASGFSGNLTNPLTIGDGVQLSSGGSTFNGSAADTLSISLATNSGLGISSNKLKVDINALTEATPAAGDFLIMRDATDSTLKKFNFSSISTSAQANVTLQNSLVAGQGLDYTTSGNYNNSAAKTMKIDFATNSGLAFSTGNELIISPAAAASISSAADDDVILIGDTSDSGNVKKIAVSALRPSALSNALTAGNGVEYTTSGATYDNTAAKTMQVKANGATVSVSSSGICLFVGFLIDMGILVRWVRTVISCEFTRMV